MRSRLFLRHFVVASWAATSLVVAGCSTVDDVPGEHDASKLPEDAADGSADARGVDATTDGTFDSVTPDANTTDAIAMDVKGETSSSDSGVDSASSDARSDVTIDATSDVSQAEVATDVGAFRDAEADQGIDAQTASDATDAAVDSGATQTFEASLTPLQEVQSTPVNSTASGKATCTLSGDRAQLTCVITHTLANVTAGHLHASAAAGQNAGPVAILVAPFSSPTTQIFGLTQQNASDVEAGRAYINLHTTAYPAAEIRGQLIRPGETFHAAQLTGTAAGVGYVGCILGADSTSLRCSGSALGLANAATTVELIANDGATVVTTFTIDTAGTAPKFSGTTTLTAAQLATYLTPGWSLRITAGTDLYVGTLAKQ